MLSYHNLPGTIGSLFKCLWTLFIWKSRYIKCNTLLFIFIIIIIIIVVIIIIIIIVIIIIRLLNWKSKLTMASNALTSI